MEQVLLHAASGRLRHLQICANIAKEGLDRSIELLRTRQLEWEQRREEYQKGEEEYRYLKRVLGSEQPSDLVLEILKHFKEGSSEAPELSGLAIDLGRLNLGY